MDEAAGQVQHLGRGMRLLCCESKLKAILYLFDDGFEGLVWVPLCLHGGVIDLCVMNGNATAGVEQVGDVVADGDVGEAANAVLERLKADALNGIKDLFLDDGLKIHVFSKGMQFGVVRAMDGANDGRGHACGTVIKSWHVTGMQGRDTWCCRTDKQTGCV